MGCPFDVCDGPAGRYMRPSSDPGCTEGGDGAPGPEGGRPEAGCAPGYEYFQGTCIPTQPGLHQNVPPSAGERIRSGTPWAGVNIEALRRLTDSLCALPALSLVCKYKWWLAGGLAAVVLLPAGGGRRR